MGECVPLVLELVRHGGLSVAETARLRHKNKENSHVPTVLQIIEERLFKVELGELVEAGQGVVVGVHHDGVHQVHAFLHGVSRQFTVASGLFQDWMLLKEGLNSLGDVPSQSWQQELHKEQIDSEPIFSVVRDNFFFLHRRINFSNCVISELHPVQEESGTLPSYQLGRYRNLLRETTAQQYRRR